MSVRNLARKYGPRAVAFVGAAGTLMAHAVDPVDANAALTSLSGITTAFGPPLFGLAVASSIIVIGIAWIKKGRGAAK